MALKMYILVRDSIDVGHAMTACAHASLACYLDFQDQNTVKEWVKNSFRKVVCKVTDAEFEEAKTYEGLAHRIMTESGLGGAETAIVFAPHDEFPAFFKKLKLYK